MPEEEIIKQVVQEVLQKLAPDGRDRLPQEKDLIPLNFSNRHVHLTREHADILFGKGYELKKIRDLIQPGQYVADEFVTLVGPEGVREKVRVLGPLRNYTQVELSIADGYQLGIRDLPIRDSADHAGTPGITIVGPKGAVTITQGVIAAQRHIHFHISDGERFGVKDKEFVRVRVEGPRALIFEKVFARVRPDFALEMHIDMDEANACALQPGAKVGLVK